LRKRFQGLGGFAKTTGFEIFYKNISVKSKSYKSKLRKARLYMIEVFSTFFVVIWILLIATLVEFENINILGRLVILLPTMFTMSFFIKFSWQYSEEKRKNELAEWHATEHMVISLLKKNLPLTLENLVEQPMKSPNCGAFNAHLKKPSKDKLLEGLRVAQKFKAFLKK
jgi:uncharacterized protein YqhQ